MSNVRSIKEFRESHDDDFWDVGVGSEAKLLAPDGTTELHWASYAKVMDYMAVAFYAKKLLVDADVILKNKLLSEADKDAQIKSSVISLRDALDSIVFRDVRGEELTEAEEDEMESEYERKALRHTFVPSMDI